MSWSNLLQVDMGKFMGAFSQVMAEHTVQERRSKGDNHLEHKFAEPDSGRELSENQCLAKSCCCSCYKRNNQEVL